MTSQILLIFIAFSVFVVCSSRTLGPAPDNQQMKVLLLYLLFMSRTNIPRRQSINIWPHVIHSVISSMLILHCIMVTVSNTNNFSKRWFTEGN